MREIKFRGKALRKTGGVFDVDWFVGYLQPWNTRLGRFAICVACIRTWTDFLIYEIEPNTIGQFTGLKDCNGKEIYEGDIIRSYGSKGDEIIHIIEYYDEEACFFTRLNGYSKGDFGCGPVRQSWINEFKKEVIGNIHDNPELIKQCNE